MKCLGIRPVVVVPTGVVTVAVIVLLTIVGGILRAAWVFGPLLLWKLGGR